MPLLGAHLSIAGGCYRAVQSASELGMDCVQLFTKNNTQWRAKPLTDEDVRLFRQTLADTGVASPCGHASYLLNLASPDGQLWKRSVRALVVELERAEALGLVGLVVHPGSHKGEGEKRGLERVARAVRTALDQTRGYQVKVVLENTAGQGTCLGWKFEHLGWLLSEVDRPERLAVCFDTCHAFAAGYGLARKQDYERTLEQLERHVGLEWLAAFHLNDSKRPLGSRVDRHEHIGLGKLGLAAFRRLLNDSRFAHLPMYLETPKGLQDGRPWDAVNLATLRRLLKPRASGSASRRKG